jgi:hypothetical protein
MTALNSSIHHEERKRKKNFGMEEMGYTPVLKPYAHSQSLSIAQTPLQWRESAFCYDADSRLSQFFMATESLREKHHCLPRERHGSLGSLTLHQQRLNNVKMKRNHVHNIDQYHYNVEENHDFVRRYSQRDDHVPQLTRSPNDDDTTADGGKRRRALSMR